MTTNIHKEEPIDGNPKNLYSTRAERGATIGCLWEITKLTKKYNIKEGACKLYIDNQGSYKQGRIQEQGEGPFRHLTKDYDYKSIPTKIENELKDIHKIDIIYQWVQGHQDTQPIRDKKGKLSPAYKLSSNK